MTRKDFELIARVLRTVEDDWTTDGWWEDEAFTPETAHEVIARRFASALTATNPRFDRERFLRAAGVRS